MTKNSWTGNGSSDSWFDASNWSNGKVPQDQSWIPVEIDGSSCNSVTVYYDEVNSTQVESLEIGDGATLDVTAAGTSMVFHANTLTIDAGGALTIDTSSAVTLGTGAVVINGTLTINDSTAVTTSHTLAGTGTIALNHATLGSASATKDLSTLNLVLEGGSTVYVNQTCTGASITFGAAGNDGSSNVLVINNVETVSTPINGFNSASVIELLTASTASSRASVSCTLNADGTSYTIRFTLDGYNYTTFKDVTFEDGYTPTGMTLEKVSGGYELVTTGTQTNTLSNKCFLAGTALLTADGPCPVEQVGVGTLLVAREGEAQGMRRVIWTGSQQVTVDPRLPMTEAGYPVRVRRDALADGVPSADLLVTAEHCLFFDGGFVPVRMLVNGVSIFYDTTITDYTYHHVETDRHAVIYAENTPTESFLDTGNRGAFFTGARSNDAPLSWERDAAAPLLTARTHVEPLYRALLARAVSEKGVAPVALTDDAALSLRLEDGTIVTPLRRTGESVVFSIPASARFVRICSRVARPSETIGPFVDDRRDLGVLVAAATLWTAEGQRNADFTDPTLGGWYPAEGSLRWTRGQAVLDLGDLSRGGSTVLVLRIMAAGPYLAVPLAA